LRQEFGLSTSGLIFAAYIPLHLHPSPSAKQHLWLYLVFCAYFLDLRQEFSLSTSGLIFAAYIALRLPLLPLEYFEQ